MTASFAKLATTKSYGTFRPIITIEVKSAQTVPSQRNGRRTTSARLTGHAKESSKIRSDIFKLQRWSDEWNLYFNVKKCHVMHIGSKNPCCKYEMKLENDLQQNETCEEEKDLGVTFDSTLSFDPHIKRIVSRRATISKPTRSQGRIVEYPIDI